MHIRPRAKYAMWPDPRYPQLRRHLLHVPLGSYLRQHACHAHRRTLQDHWARAPDTISYASKSSTLWDVL